MSVFRYALQIGVADAAPHRLHTTHPTIVKMLTLRGVERAAPHDLEVVERAPIYFIGYSPSFRVGRTVEGRRAGVAA